MLSANLKYVNLKLNIFYYYMKNIYVSVILIGHGTQVLRTNQHGEHFQAEVTYVFPEQPRKYAAVILFLRKCCHFIPKKVLSFYS